MGHGLRESIMTPLQNESIAMQIVAVLDAVNVDTARTDARSVLMHNKIGAAKNMAKIHRAANDMLYGIIFL